VNAHQVLSSDQRASGRLNSGLKIWFARPVFVMLACLVTLGAASANNGIASVPAAAGVCFHSFSGVGVTVLSHGSIEAYWA
jgi:hypothetical protein